ncbi:hypothetical protein PVOR_28359 [Paenibacillus vortex V453]|uniref:Uncharacterized protein n=1 Tax=Paenibacillus vortex V453 TaxID=715225 RepID=A0A2R9SMZ5_9BACL|nr:hypothetical protein PVOR_28359 [Paenibacillus vortex V453]
MGPFAYFPNKGNPSGVLPAFLADIPMFHQVSSLQGYRELQK